PTLAAAHQESRHRRFDRTRAQHQGPPLAHQHAPRRLPRVAAAESQGTHFLGFAAIGAHGDSISGALSCGEWFLHLGHLKAACSGMTEPLSPALSPVCIGKMNGWTLIYVGKDGFEKRFPAKRI